jgi:hypothetical protein
MESVARPGAVTLSDSTARLVEGAVVLGEPQQVRIGADDAVPARRLLSIATATNKDFRESYRDMANSLGFEGHIAWAETMPQRRRSVGRLADRPREQT